MKIAIVGTGIAGNLVAHHLHREHELTLYEAGDHVGGHTHTHSIDLYDRTYAIDTGFIVYNDRTYPNFIALLDELGVASRPTTMSFGVKCGNSGLEYCGASLNSLFAQRRNLLRPAFYRMLRDVLRFNREAVSLLNSSATDLSLGDYLAQQGYDPAFLENYIVPMGAAIWSTDPQRMLSFPAVHFVRFFHHHGLLTINDHPQWRVIDGGSKQYVDKLVAPFRQRIRLATPVSAIQRHDSHVTIRTANGDTGRYDAVFIACHSDQALAMLESPTPQEHAVLGAIPYQRNSAVLHTDTSLLPRNRRAWAAWNYHRLDRQHDKVAVTYNMNMLQGIVAPETFCVTLNNDAAIDPGKVIRQVHYEHPVFTQAAVAAQPRQREINGVRRTWYCGAYWRNGFHEDGVVSALDALQHFREQTDHAQQPLRRTG